MHLIKGYEDYINRESLLLESILYTSPKFNEIIRLLKNEDIVANYLYPLFNLDIKTDYNFIDLSDKEDSVKFLSDNQATTKLKSGKTIDEMFLEKGNATSVGRIVRKILSDNGVVVGDKDMENFVNRFKSHSSAGQKVDKIKLISGDEIKGWYRDSNYCRETLEGKGSLGNSCMRYDKCSNFFDIYTKNPDQVKLAILVDDATGKLRARALLWQTSDGTSYLDRIYFTADFERENFKQFAKKNNINFGYDINPANRKVMLGTPGDYKYYPYMDTFKFYYTDDGVLFTYNPTQTAADRDMIKVRKNLLLLQKTDGSGVPQDLVRCDIEGVTVREEQAIYATYSNCYVTRANAVYSNTANSYLYKNSSKQSKKFNDYLPNDMSVKVFFDRRGGSNIDFYPSSEIGKSIVFVVNFKNGGYFPIDYKGIIKVGENYWFSDGVKIEHDIVSGNKDMLKEFYGMKSTPIRCTSLDASIFGLEIDTERVTVSQNDNFYYVWYLNSSIKNMGEILEGMELKKMVANKKHSEIKKATDYLYEKYYSFAWRNYREMNPEDVKVWESIVEENYVKIFDIQLETFEKYNMSVVKSIEEKNAVHSFGNMEIINKLMYENILNFTYGMYNGYSIFYVNVLYPIFRLNSNRGSVEYYTQTMFRGIMANLVRVDKTPPNIKKYFNFNIRYNDSNDKMNLLEK